MNKDIIPETRAGIKDLWNSWMLDGAQWTERDIPICPTTATGSPIRLMSYWDAKALHRKQIRKGNSNYYSDAYVHTYGDDQKFDGIRSGIWQHPAEAVDILKHFEGFITPDYSTYADFPDPIKRYNTFRMRAVGYYAGRCGLKVINNVRWGTPETWEYCFDGIPQKSVVAIGTVASDIRRIDNRPLFEEGFREMVRRLQPRAVVVYGSSNSPALAEAKQSGIEVLAFASNTDLAHRKAASHE